MEIRHVWMTTWPRVRYLAHYFPPVTKLSPQPIKNETFKLRPFICNHARQAKISDSLINFLNQFPRSFVDWATALRPPQHVRFLIPAASSSCSPSQEMNMSDISEITTDESSKSFYNRYCIPLSNLWTLAETDVIMDLDSPLGQLGEMSCV